VLLGNAAGQHPDSAALERLARWIAEQTGATFGWLVDGGNSVGAQLVGAARRGRLDAGRDARRGAAQGLPAAQRRAGARRRRPPRALAALAAPRWSSR
jgi:NADH-quinone oxidoreductase subunit G